MTPKSGIARALADALRIRQELGGQAMNDIPPAVTLYWQEERIKELEAALKWAVQELRRCDNEGYANHIADTLSEALGKGSPHEPTV